MTAHNVHVVFGASGGAGGALVRHLAARGCHVRAVTRRGARNLPAGVEDVRADATDAAAARAACGDAVVVYHCVNVPYTQWHDVLPRVMDGLIAAAAGAGARLVYCDNLYMYGRPEGPMAEDAPRAARGPKGRLRARLEDVVMAAHASGRIQATIGRGSDFFGPGAANTLAGNLVFPAVAAAKRAYWLGSLDAAHTLSYVEDFARGLAILGAQTRAVGEVWHIPAAPPVTGRQFIEMAFDVARREPKVGVYPRWMLRLAAPFRAQMRELLEVLPQFEHPFVLDTRKFSDAFGDIGVTPLRAAIERSLAEERPRAARAADAPPAGRG